MSLLQDDHAFEVLEALLAESPGDATYATLECVEERAVPFGPEGPREAHERERLTLAVTVRFEAVGGGFHEARATAGSLDPHEARAALRRAATLARLAAPRLDAPPLAGSVEVVGTAPERPTQDHSFREKHALVAAALARAEAEGLLAEGHVVTRVANRTFASSAGRRVHAARSRASFAVELADPPGGRGGRGLAQRIEPNVDRLDPAAVVERALQATLATRDAGPAPSGALTVVFAPPAVAALLGCLDFGADAYAAGRSFLCGRVGERIFPDLLRLTEEPAPPHGHGWVLDGLGAPALRVPLLVEGALTGPVTDAHWARVLGLADTGHAPWPPPPGLPMPGLPMPGRAALGAAACGLGGPRATSLSVAPGHRTHADLVAAVDDGLIVADLADVAVRDARDLELDAVSRGAALRVRGGRVVGAVAPVRLSGALVEWLTRVRDVGASPERCCGAFDFECVAATVRVDGARVTPA